MTFEDRLRADLQGTRVSGDLVPPGDLADVVLVRLRRQRSRRVLLGAGMAVLAAGAVVALLGAVLPAASPTIIEPAATENPFPPPPQPYDVLLGRELADIEYAQSQLSSECLAEAGFPQNRDALAGRHPEGPVDGLGLLVSAWRFAPPSEQYARRYGFGLPTPGEPPKIISTDPAYDEALVNCEADAWARLGPGAEATVSSYYDLATRLARYWPEATGSLPVDLSARMYDCMVARGYPAKRDQFLESPTEYAFGIPFGGLEDVSELDWQPGSRPGHVYVGPAIPPREYTPTPEEVDLAVAWYGCRQSTGRDQATYAALFETQQRYVDQYRDEITELNEKVRSLYGVATQRMAGI